MTAGGSNSELLEKVWNWAKKLQLKTEELSIELFLAKSSLIKHLGIWQQDKATLKY
jgi:hypothetical protein